MKYKEYWLHKAFKMPWTVHEHDITDGNPHHLEKCFKVIEYQALLDEAEAHKNTAAVLQSEVEKLQKQNEKLKAIVTRASKQGCNTVNQYDCLACDATKILKEIEEDKNTKIQKHKDIYKNGDEA